MIGDEESFAEQVLAVAPTERFVEVGFRILYKRLKVFCVGTNSGDALIPGVTCWRLWGFWPVVVGPLHAVIAAGWRRGEVEDVALCDAKVIEDLPGGVGKITCYSASEICGKVLDYFVEGDVGLSAVKEGDQLFA